MPFAGLHSYRNDNATGIDPGLRLGTFLGGRINDIASLNAELRLDITNPSDIPPGTDFTEVVFAFTFSPLFQIPAGAVEIVVGPKLGAFVLYAEQSDAGGSASADVTGLVAGANLGVFVPVSPTTSLGVLISYDLEEAEKVYDEHKGAKEVEVSETGWKLVK